VSTAHEAHGAEHGHEHHGSPFTQHHYDDAQHQFDSGKLGIWLFLAQEVLFFSALFVAYILYRVHHPEIYSYAHKWLDVKFGAINTAVLIFSSLTAAWAVRCAQLNQKRGLIVCIVLTIGCALTFLAIKYIEYSHKVHEHILFGRFFDPCISPGGVELLTKHNDCPGSKSTITWSLDPVSGDIDLLKGTGTGCFDATKLDQDPREEGVQADCAVFEVQRRQQPKKDPKTGKDVLDAKGKPVMEWVEASRKPLSTACKEHKPWEKGEAETFPCWRPAYQPAVCPDKTKPEDRARGAAAQPQVGILVEYGDGVERGEEIAIDAKCKDAVKPAAAADQFADREETRKVGDKAIRPVHELTVEEEHELESAGPPPEHTNMFFTVYFAMTGLHGIHVLFGVFVFVWLLIRAVKGHFTPDYFGPIDFAALYWHIVDLIWIFLFPLLYLIH
jgi:cytochrome c oxidase subunit 3